MFWYFWKVQFITKYQTLSLAVRFSIWFNFSVETHKFIYKSCFLYIMYNARNRIYNSYHDFSSFIFFLMKNIVQSFKCQSYSWQNVLKFIRTSFLMWIKRKTLYNGVHEIQTEFCSRMFKWIYNVFWLNFMKILNQSKGNLTFVTFYKIFDRFQMLYISVIHNLKLRILSFNYV